MEESKTTPPCHPENTLIIGGGRVVRGSRESVVREIWSGRKWGGLLVDAGIEP